ncbi:CaiB/BaiF CoA transferase family protein [Tuberibacillus calidus]|jgi:crotonobetainyl-CoA:carnitine CoA-transferase CaiB-like acyl-CoA transferase|uniref:CaiB/BaiF CoA transferase family protein n=1 Tax=Tuberibacillus calidus TaxID=340097 RepID=UPI000420EF7F|nr:CaiB/BaiF CoA-transferase family protein [Tuberibacillus calidus]
MSQNNKKLPLSGIRVVELGNLIAGPFCTKILAEFGAEVIKIELPKVGDPLRNWRILHNGTSLWWYVQSRNKKCLTLDVRTPEGLEVIKKLLKESDVLVENFRPGTIAKWGLTPEVLEALNPNLIVSHISGYGQNGPYSDRPGFGSIGEAMGGLRYITGYPDRPPVRVGISIGDSVAALYSVIGILLALYYRDVKDGGGQEIDVALYEAVFSLMEGMIPEYDKKGVIRERTGSSFPGIVPTNTYQTKDGKYLVLAANSDNIFQRLLKVMGREDLVGDERFLTNENRVKNQDFIESMIEAWVQERTLDECLKVLNDHAIPAGRIYNAEDIIHDPHYRARDMIVEMENEALGTVKVPGIVPKLSRTPGELKWLGPKIGEHNLEVLKAIGLSEEQINQMKERGVI